MSRIGKKKIAIPPGVTVTAENNIVRVKGPKGELSRTLNSAVSVSIADNQVSVVIADEQDTAQRALWGTFAAHIMNMIAGVVTGFKKQLEINGVGYRVAMQGKDLKLEVGFSHPVVYPMPTGVHASVEKNVITLESADIELLGKTAAELRNVRKPEPYKGKGIKYMEEHIRRKAGKAAKSASA